MITVFTTKDCAPCSMVKRYLAAKKVPFVVEDVTNDPARRVELREKTGYSIVPVITDGTTYIAGWRVAQIADLVRKQLDG